MDWIDSFTSATDAMLSPRRFRLWTAIFTVASALERKVWSPSINGSLYPNIYACLSGPSGSGKTTAILVGRNILSRVKEIQLGPDNMSNASFYDALYESGKMTGISNGGTPNYYSAMAVISREIGVLFPKYEQGFLSDLSDLYDNPPIYNSKRRLSKSVQIDSPTVNLLIGATPSYLSDLFPESAWGQGFCARMVFIFAFNPVVQGIDLLLPAAAIGQTPTLAAELSNLTHLSGEFKWSPAAHKELNLWYNDGSPADDPQHTRLIEYRTRRNILAMKLSMISAISSGHGLTLHLSDFERGRGWMRDAETAMPELFHGMNTGADSKTLQDLGYQVKILYERRPIGKREPVSDQELWKFLSSRVDSPRIRSVIDAAARSGIIRKGPFPDEWLPA